MGDLRLFEWQVFCLATSPARFVGFVEAADEQDALKRAVAVFKIRPEEQKRLLAMLRS
jgi:1,2-phenylacetyl-CoA epoxidase PaaB subunit